MRLSSRSFGRLPERTDTSAGKLVSDHSCQFLVKLESMLDRIRLIDVLGRNLIADALAEIGKAAELSDCCGGRGPWSFIEHSVGQPPLFLQQPVSGFQHALARPKGPTRILWQHPSRAIKI